jgi:hypothetical protein
VALKLRIKRPDDTCGEGNYCVRLHSRRASLVSEFCLDKRENDIPDIEAAEKLLRRAMAPCDFAAATVTLIDGEGTDDESVYHLDPRQT